jgi:hypothetical protein
MHAKDRRLLISKFSAIVASLNPQFLPFSGASEYIFPKHSYYSYKHSSDSSLFLDLYINQKNNTSDFTVQFGWSRLGRFPEVLSVHFYMDDFQAGVKRYSQPEYLQRVAMFLGGDTWWPFDSGNPTECTKTLKTVEDLLREKVVPYLVKALDNRS